MGWATFLAHFSQTHLVTLVVSKRVETGVARFVSPKCTKTGKNYQMATKLPNGHIIYQMALKYSK
jgi:hypothetical protein